jgi:hypothetical protein
MEDAIVACRQLGFTKTVGTWWNGRGTGKVWLYNMQCAGTETSLQSCTHNAWGNVQFYCNGHTYDVGLRFMYMIVPVKDLIRVVVENQKNILIIY